MRHRDLDNLAHRLDRAANIIPDALGHLDQQRTLIAYIAANDPSRPHAHAVSDPTGYAVEQLDQVEYRRTEIRDFIASAQLCIKLLEESYRRALAFRIGQTAADTSHLADTPTCITCTQIPTPRSDPHGTMIDDRRCLDCGRQWDAEQARRRHESNQRRLRRHSVDTRSR